MIHSLKTTQKKLLCILFYIRLLFRFDDRPYVFVNSITDIEIGALLAQHLEKRLVVRDKEKFYRYENNLSYENMRPFFEKANAVIVTDPLLIPYAVYNSTLFKVDFLFFDEKFNFLKSLRNESCIGLIFSSLKDESKMRDTKRRLESLGHSVTCLYRIEKRIEVSSE